MTTPNPRPISFYLLLALIFFQGTSGLWGGSALILDPTGDMLQMPISLLDGSPFDNYLIPGIILLLGLGVFPLFVFYGVLQRKTWAWAGALLVGVALLIWIGIEILMIGYQTEPPLQFIYGLVGIILLVLTQLKSVKNTLESKGRTDLNVSRSLK